MISLPVAELDFRKECGGSGESGSLLASSPPEPAVRASDSRCPDLPEIKANIRWLQRAEKRLVLLVLAARQALLAGLYQTLSTWIALLDCQCCTSVLFLSQCSLGVRPAVEQGQPDPAPQNVIFNPSLCCFSLLQSLSGRRSTNKDTSCALCNHCIWLWNLALILGLIPLLLQVPWRITVFGNAPGTWGSSAPKTYLSTQVPFSTDNSLAGGWVSHKPHQWHSQSALLQNAHIRELCKEIHPRFKSSVSKSLIWHIKFVQRGCIFYLTRWYSWKNVWGFSVLHTIWKCHP